MFVVHVGCNRVLCLHVVAGCLLFLVFVVLGCRCCSVVGCSVLSFVVRARRVCWLLLVAVGCCRSLLFVVVCCCLLLLGVRRCC